MKKITEKLSGIFLAAVGPAASRMNDDMRRARNYGNPSWGFLAMIATAGASLPFYLERPVSVTPERPEAVSTVPKTPSNMREMETILRRMAETRTALSHAGFTTDKPESMCGENPSDSCKERYAQLSENLVKPRAAADKDMVLKYQTTLKSDMARFQTAMYLDPTLSEMDVTRLANSYNRAVGFKWATHADEGAPNVRSWAFRNQCIISTKIDPMGDQIANVDKMKQCMEDRTYNHYAKEGYRFGQVMVDMGQSAATGLTTGFLLYPVTGVIGGAYRRRRDDKARKARGN